MNQGQRFFISFNSKDRQKAEWIAWTLREAGHQVAVHTWEVPAGGNIPTWMNEKLAWAERLVAVVSPDYVDAVYSMMEWTTMVWDDPSGTSGSVIPVIVRSTVDLPPLLKGLSQVDLTGRDEKEAAELLIQRVSRPRPPQVKPKFEPTPPGQHERGPASKPDFELEDVLPQYLDSVIYNCGTARVIGMDRPRPLEDLFVKTSFLNRVRGRSPAPSVTGGSPVVSAEQAARVSLDDVLIRETKVLLIGGPGMGKSTLLRFLAVRLARHALNGDDGALIPVFIPLHDLATSSKPFVEYVVELFVGESPAPGLQDKVSDALREGRCWVFLDGLDEVDTDTQHNLLASIQRLTDHYRHSRFLITTRPGHYFSQLEQFTEYELAPFDGNQLRDFATRWFGPDSRSAEMFLGALARDSRMIEIASTPLLLTLLCLEYQQSATIPADRAAFYDHSVDILLRTWDASRGLRRARLPDLTVARLRKLYSSLAAHFFCAARLTFERADLEQTLSEVLRDELGLQGTFDAAELLPMLEMQHGILIKKWRSVYGFSHLTFQEYFVAAAVVASPEGTDHGFASVVSEHLSEVRWREVIVLAAQLLRRNGDPISALTAAIDRLKTSEVHRSLTRVRMLLEHCSIIPSLAHKFVALGLAVYDFSLTDEVYYDKGFAAAPYKAAFGLDWSEVPTEDYRESYRLLKDTVRRLGEESPDLVNAPIAIWQGYSEDEEWGNGPNLRETVMRANFDPAVVSSFEGRFSPGAYEEIRRFIYAANVLVECMGSRNVEAAGYAIFG